MALALWAAVTLASVVPGTPPQQPTLSTRWTAQVSRVKPHPEYPRPQMVRKHWVNLNGPWNVTEVAASSAIQPKSQKILVPFPYESKLSGIGKMLPEATGLRYERSFVKPAAKAGERVLLQFGAVDWEAIVYVNEKP